MIILTFLPLGVQADISAPIFKAKLGYSDLTINAGELARNQSLGSALTVQPSVLWNISHFNSRVGLHFIADYASKYGTTPISGIGLSGYYYLGGLTSVHEQVDPETLVQKTRSGLFTFASFTPVNFNLNKIDTANPSKSFAPSSTVYELMFGFGFEYPLRQNLLISAELAKRDGALSTLNKELNYSGFFLAFSLSTSYH